MMRISTNWLNDYVDISDENLKELAKKITDAGVNVATVEEYNLEAINGGTDALADVFVISSDKEGNKSTGRAIDDDVVIIEEVEGE